MECDCSRLQAIRRKIGMLLHSMSMCTHDTASNSIWHNLSGVDNDDFVAILVYMVTCLLKCYDQGLGVCDKPLLNAWTMVMVFENGFFRVSMPASNSLMIREISRSRHSPLGEDTLITYTKGPTLHLQL